ncbi:MAG: hypothetical protein KDA33_16815 [Phycisphaerales bacterium]|nr:hypothetical protein [Phycisphaerales bacterium]
MTHIIARLLLAMLGAPLALVILIAGLCIDVATGGRPDFNGILLSWVATDLFIVVYWVLIWRSSVRWNVPRVRQTLAAIGLGAFAVFVGVYSLKEFARVPLEPATIFGGILFPIVFTLLTIVNWRETPAERAARIRDRGAEFVLCSTCGYNLAGLREARCPECGTVFTLDELFAAQRPPAPEELTDAQ